MTDRQRKLAGIKLPEKKEVKKLPERKKLESKRATERPSDPNALKLKDHKTASEGLTDRKFNPKNF